MCVCVCVCVCAFFFSLSRGTFDRQDSVRSDYMSDRDGRYGIVQQASLESTDSRICYLTSSEVSSCWPYQPDISISHFSNSLLPSVSRTFYKMEIIPLWSGLATGGQIRIFPSSNNRKGSSSNPCLIDDNRSRITKPRRKRDWINFSPRKRSTRGEILGESSKFLFLFSPEKFSREK